MRDTVSNKRWKAPYNQHWRLFSDLHVLLPSILTGTHTEGVGYSSIKISVIHTYRNRPYKFLSSLIQLVNQTQSVRNQTESMHTARDHCWARGRNWSGQTHYCSGKHKPSWGWVTHYDQSIFTSLLSEPGWVWYNSITIIWTLLSKSITIHCRWDKHSMVVWKISKNTVLEWWSANIWNHFLFL